jgi:hypothetical protein
MSGEYSMNNNKVCIPKQSRNRRNFLFWTLGSVILGCFVVLVFSILAILIIINGRNPFDTPEVILGVLVVFVLGPIVIIKTIKMDLKRTWIEIRETDFRISKGIIWNEVPYKDITEINKLNNNDIKISYGDSTILLKREDLDDCYDILLSRLQISH